MLNKRVVANVLREGEEKSILEMQQRRIHNVKEKANLPNQCIVAVQESGHTGR